LGGRLDFAAAAFLVGLAGFAVRQQIEKKSRHRTADPNTHSTITMQA